MPKYLSPQEVRARIEWKKRLGEAWRRARSNAPRSDILKQIQAELQKEGLPPITDGQLGHFISPPGDDRAKLRVPDTSQIAAIARALFFYRGWGQNRNAAEAFAQILGADSVWGSEDPEQWTEPAHEFDREIVDVMFDDSDDGQISPPLERLRELVNKLSSTAPMSLIMETSTRLDDGSRVFESLRSFLNDGVRFICVVQSPSELEANNLLSNIGTLLDDTFDSSEPIWLSRRSSPSSALTYLRVVTLVSGWAPDTTGGEMRVQGVWLEHGTRRRQQLVTRHVDLFDDGFPEEPSGFLRVLLDDWTDPETSDLMHISDRKAWLR